jgi:hypothetical protein
MMPNPADDVGRARHPVWPAAAKSGHQTLARGHFRHLEISWTDDAGLEEAAENLPASFARPM